VAIGEVIADVREGLLAMAVGAGPQVMAAMMSEDVTVACGLKGKHDANRVRPVMAARTAASPSAAGGCRSCGRGCVRQTAPANCRYSAKRSSAALRRWAGWRWRRCWPGSAMGQRRTERRRDGPGQVSQDPAQVADGLGVQRRRQSRGWAVSETRMRSCISCPRFLG
jgi:hypothetical protein